MTDRPTNNSDGPTRSFIFLMIPVALSAAVERLNAGAYANAALFFGVAVSAQAAGYYWPNLKNCFTPKPPSGAGHYMILIRIFILFIWIAVLTAYIYSVHRSVSRPATSKPAAVDAYLKASPDTAGKASPSEQGDKPASPKRQPSTQQAPLPAPTEGRQAREITRATPDFLRRITSNKSYSDRHEAFSPFKRKWMHVSGTIRDGSIGYDKDSGYSLTIGHRDGQIGEIEVLYYDSSYREYIVGLKDGQEVKALCQIRDLFVGSLFLEHCEPEE